MTAILYVQSPSGQLSFSGSSSGRAYKWSAVDHGETVEVDEADVPELLKLKFQRGRDCGCSGSVPAHQGNNETVFYFSRNKS